MQTEHALHSIPDDELLRRLGALVSHSRRVEADLVAHIGEADERQLYAREASPSMFMYCTERLHLSEAEAYLRIAAARASREHPVLLAMLGDGRLHLTGIAKLAPHLTLENRDALLERATHRTKRQIEELIAEIAPKPDAPTVIRRLPARPAPRSAASSLDPHGVAPAIELRLDGVALAPRAAARDTVAAQAPPVLRPDAVASLALADERASPALVKPLAPTRYKVQFTATAQLRDKLQRLQALMRSQVPDGDLAAIIEQAVSEKLERLEAKRFARTIAPRRRLPDTDTSPFSRHIPAAVKRAVCARDGDRCRYVDEQGRRCAERDRLEYHHRRPFGFGGDHSLQNIRLMCAPHNQYLAEHDYGREAMARHPLRTDSHGAGIHSTRSIGMRAPGPRSK
jgi:hypothetical protein